MNTISDPAMELASMCEWFSKLKGIPSNRNAAQALSATLDGSEYPERPYVLLGVAQQRFTDFISIIDTIEDPFLDASLVASARQAASELRSFCALEKLQESWSNRAALVGKKEYLNSIRTLSPSCRKFQPINKLSDDEINALRSLIDEKLFESINESNLPPYISYSLTKGLRDLLIEIEYFPIYGFHRISITAFDIYAHHSAAESESSNYRKSSAFSKIKKIIGIAISGLVITDAAIEAAGNHYDRATQIYDLVVERPALPAPTSHTHTDQIKEI